MSIETRYWMVHGSGPANAMHTTYESAKQEAQRLARCSPGTTFFVLQAVRAFRKVDAEEMDVRGGAPSEIADEDLPF